MADHGGGVVVETMIDAVPNENPEGSMVVPRVALRSGE